MQVRKLSIIILLASIVLLLVFGPDGALRTTARSKSAWSTACIFETQDTLKGMNAAQPTLSNIAQDNLFSVLGNPPAPSLRGAQESAAIQSPTSNWHTEYVDLARRVTNMTDRSLRLDSAGHPHLAYGGEHLYYASLAPVATMAGGHDGATWQVEIVDDAPEVGYYASLALDGAGRPHISYYDDTNGTLKYAWHNGSSWQIETVPTGSSDFAGRHTSLALDAAGHPHISYFVEDRSANKTFWILSYAWHNGWNWETSEIYTGRTNELSEYLPRAVKNPKTWAKIGTFCTFLAIWELVHDNSLALPGYTSLALDAWGVRSYVSYYGGRDLKYAWRYRTNWQVETVDSDGGGYTSLALDGARRPHISYYDNTNGDLKYAWHNGSSWQIEAVDSEGNVGAYTSLALDTADRPHISYYDNTNGDLKYAWHNGSSWQIETVDGVGDLGLFTSLALDGAGWPHISYYDDTNGGLKYARLMPPSLSLYKQAIPSDDVRNNEALTYTLTLSGPGLSVRLWDPLPPNAHYVSGSLTGTVAPPAVYSPTIRAVLWRGTLPTDTVSVLRFQVTPGLTGTGSPSLSLPIVNTAWLTDTVSGVGVSATTIVNAWRFYMPLVVRND